MSTKFQLGFAPIFILAGIIILGLIILVFYLFSNSQPKTAAVKSTVFWDQKSAQNIAKGNYLSGKGIPNAKVEIEISPANLKEKIPTNQYGNWSYKIPETVKPGKYQVKISVLDKGGDKATEKSYEIQVSNREVLKLWNPLEPKAAFAQEKPRQFPEEVYARYGFPRPNSEFTKLNDGEIHRWRKYFLPHALKAGDLLGVDFGILGMWVYFENHMMVYQDNCFDGKPNKSNLYEKLADINQNTHCSGWYLFQDGRKIPSWQVGWGIYPYESGEEFREDFKAATYILHRGKSLAEIGEAVKEGSYREDSYWNENPQFSFTPTTTTYNPDIPPDPITNPDPFPEDVSIDEIIDGSLPIGGTDRKTAQNARDPNMRQLLGILLKDEAISSYMLARHFKQVEQENNGRIADDVGNWFGGNGDDDKVGAKNLQTDINLIATLYAYSFGMDEVTITSVETTDGDGKILPGEQLDVTAVCSYDGWIAGSECQRVWALERTGGAGAFDFIHPKVYAQEEVSDINALPGGQNCDQTCTITIPTTTAPGTYNLRVYGADGVEIFGSDSQVITIGAVAAAQPGNSCTDEEYSEFVSCDTCGKEIWKCPKTGDTKSGIDNPGGDCAKNATPNPACTTPGPDLSTRVFTDSEGNRIPFFSIQLGDDDTGTNERTYQEATARLSEMQDFEVSLDDLLTAVTDSRVRDLITNSKSKLAQNSQNLNACIAQ